jgi:gliding motility-associated lipoprotein GldB
MRAYRFPLLMSVAVALGSCNTDPLDVDVSKIKVEMEFKRLDIDLFALDPTEGRTDTRQLQADYGAFFTDYCEGVTRIGSPSDPGFDYSVAQFITDESIRVLRDDVQAEYADVSDIEDGLRSAFTYFRYHFPDSTIPTVVFNISALNYAIVATRTHLGIGLDMFLGADHPVYPMVGLPKYMYRNMKRQQVVPQAMKGWLQSMYEEDATRNNLLEYMVFEGKLLYVLDAVLRTTPDSVKMGFTPDEMAWCTENEPRIWAHLVDEELLFKSEYMTINKWINQAPFVAGIPKESPGRLGQWVGWQIVRAYMKENPSITVQELMQNDNAQDILNRSKYKPKL